MRLACRRRARLRSRLQPFRRASPRHHRAGDADRAPTADRAGGEGGHRPARRGRSATASASARASRRTRMAGDCSNRGARPARAAPERDAARRRCPRLLSAAPAASPAGVSRRHELRGASGASEHRCLRAPARPAAPTSAGCRPRVPHPDRTGRRARLAAPGRRRSDAAQRAGATCRRPAKEGRSRPPGAGVGRGTAARCSDPTERALRERAAAMDAADPRLEWLLSQAPRLEGGE